MATEEETETSIRELATDHAYDFMHACKRAGFDRAQIMASLSFFSSVVAGTIILNFSPDDRAKMLNKTVDLLVRQVKENISQYLDLVGDKTIEELIEEYSDDEG